MAHGPMWLQSLNCDDEKLCGYDERPHGVLLKLTTTFRPNAFVSVRNAVIRAAARGLKSGGSPGLCGAVSRVVQGEVSRTTCAPAAFISASSGVMPAIASGVSSPSAETIPKSLTVFAPTSAPVT